MIKISRQWLSILFCPACIVIPGLMPFHPAERLFVEIPLSGSLLECLKPSLFSMNFKGISQTAKHLKLRSNKPLVRMVEVIDPLKSYLKTSYAFRNAWSSENNRIIERRREVPRLPARMTRVQINITDDEIQFSGEFLRTNYGGHGFVYPGNTSVISESHLE